MGYHITIVRTQGRQQKPISQNEVDSAVALMPDLKIESDTHWDYIISLPPHGDAGACLLFSNGEIWAKNPERETLQVMLDLAKKLNARVRGDEFETYRTPEESYQHPDDFAAIQASQQEVRQFKCRVWLWRIVIFVVFTILGLLVAYFSR